MKLTKKEVGDLWNIITTANLGGVDAIVIQDKSIGIASGIMKGKCAIIVRDNVPLLEQKMGLSRLPILKKRLELLYGNDSLEILPKTSERGEIVQLEMVAGKSKTQFRCTASVAILAPASVNDGGMCGILTISKEELTIILNSIRAMGAEQIVLVVKQDGNVFFETTDTNDKFTVELEKPIERVGEEEADSAVFYYETGIFSNLLRAALGTSDSLSLAVGITGTIQFDLNNCEMSIFAQIEGANT